MKNTASSFAVCLRTTDYLPLKEALAKITSLLSLWTLLNWISCVLPTFLQVNNWLSLCVNVLLGVNFHIFLLLSLKIFGMVSYIWNKKGVTHKLIFIFFCSGMFVAYTNSDGVSKEVTLLAPPDCNKGHAIAWLSAMQNGFRFATDG